MVYVNGLRVGIIVYRPELAAVKHRPQHIETVVVLAASSTFSLNNPNPR